jgi:hypothetical protein
MFKKSIPPGGIHAKRFPGSGFYCYNWYCCFHVAWGRIIVRFGILTFTYIIVGSGNFCGLEYSEEDLMTG